MVEAARALPAAVRHVKGVNLIGLVKLLRVHRKTQPLTGLSPTAEAFLSEHIVISDWYAFEPFMELVQATYRELLGRSEGQAREMGVVGGRMALSGLHKQFVKPGDPAASLMAMRHTWRVYFDFGELTVERDGPQGVRFTVDGYGDMPAAHGQMIVGWHVAAALEAGATNARSIVLEAPWRRGERLLHRVTF